MTITLRRTFTLLAAVTIAVATLATCGDDDGSADVPNLDGKWAVDASALEEPAKSGIDDTNRPTITFAGETVTGFGGCNNFNGGVTYDDKKMDFSDLTQTFISCGNPGDQIEGQFMALLNSVKSYEKTGTTLRMMDQKGLVVLTFGAV